MSPVILFGVVTVNLALIAYTAGVIAEQRGRRASLLVLGALTLGLGFDLIATGCMMAGSHRPWFTPHGIVGFAALAAMLAAVGLLWNLHAKRPDAEVPPGPRLFLRISYAGWLVAYAIGAALAARR
jgi:hypothetical protein